MNRELLERFIREYLSLFTGNVLFIWHGGEPLLAGLGFFEEIIRLQCANRRDHTIRNVIQTNATLVDDTWAAFFGEQRFEVGVSIDGGIQSHDAFRVTRGGRGTHDAVLRGIETLRRHGVSPGFIQTLTARNVSNIQEDFRFFATFLHAKSWGVNAFLDMRGVHDSKSEQSVSNEQLTTLLREYVDLWLAKDDGDLRIREVEDFLAGVAGKRAANCTFNGFCTAYFCLEYNGKIYPCDRLTHCENLLWGDMSERQLIDILNGERRLSYATQVNRLHPDCETCEWHPACHNGCTHHRNGGIDGKYHYCETRKALFGYLREKLVAFRTTPHRTACEGGEGHAGDERHAGCSGTG